jgi:hypothetical protein
MFLRRILEKVFNSYAFHLSINVLVICNMILIFVDLTLEYIELSLVESDFVKLRNALATYLTTSNETVLQLEFSYELSKSHTNYSNARSTLRIVMLSIQTFFMAEIVLKVAFVPHIFTENKLEVLDSIFILISFISILIVFTRGRDIVSIVSLITLTRLWRIAVVFKC